MGSTQADAAAAPMAAQLSRLRALLRQQKFAELLAAGQTLLEEGADHRDIALFVAIAQRHLNRVEDALGTLASLEGRYPRFSRVHEERGHCFVALRRAPQAIESFVRAVNLNQALPSSWRMLEALYRMTGQIENAALAARHVATLAGLPREVLTATSLFADGDLDAAEPMVRSFLLRHGNHLEAMRLLAGIGTARKVFDDAELLLSAALAIAPNYRAARQDYAGVLVAMHKYREAQLQLDQLLEVEPENTVLLNLYAATCAGLGDYERAIELYRKLLRATPDDADLYLSMAHALKTVGRREQAIDAYRTAASRRPTFGDAYWSLANLKTYRFTAEELTRLRTALAAPAIRPVDRWHLCFALGKALEDRQEYAESFRWYGEGNALMRAESHYRPELIEGNTRQQIAVCTADFFARRRGWGAPAPDPIFIVGLPRSGSTLLEQILASHSQVEGTQELGNIQQFAQTLLGRDPDMSEPRYPRILAEMEAEDFRKLGEQYLADTQVYRKGRAAGSPGVKPFFIDKMPNNFRHIGLIHMILPNAKIIDARREPMACCFSNFKQLFARGQEFSYGIDDIARYYRTYLELMRHWDHVLPGRVLRIFHEDVVADLGGNVRRLLDYCGLDFEPQCIEFHRTERSVRTASSEQVRQPLYREGLEHWKHFEPWLEPLKLALGDALYRYRDESGR
jgi:tetratricopeptide (TPR) repeat protein